MKIDNNQLIRRYTTTTNLSGAKRIRSKSQLTGQRRCGHQVNLTRHDGRPNAVLTETPTKPNFRLEHLFNLSSKSTPTTSWSSNREERITAPTARGCSKQPTIPSRTRRAIKMFKVITSLLVVLLNLAATQMGLCMMSLPDGIENILGFVPSSNFQCQRDGYFGDIDNDCRIFHLCQKQVHPNGRIEWRHWTYACGNQTMFNQLTLTCAFVDEAIPCKHASQFQYLNEVIHKPQEPFLTDADVTSGISYYSNRIMSDGARARAFEDSRLMAQIGGGSTAAASGSGQQHPQASHQQHHAHLSVGLSSAASHSSNRFNDVDDTSSRTVNSIELPELPLSENFRSALSAAQINHNKDHQPRHHHNRQQQPSAITTTTSTANQRNDLIINLQNQFQQHFSAAPLTTTAATTSVRQTTQTGGSENLGLPRVSTHQGLRQQQPRVAPETQSPPTAGQSSSFDFSISTNHQVGPASASPDAAIVVVSNQSGQQVQQPSVVPTPTNQQQQRQEPAGEQMLSGFAALSSGAAPPPPPPPSTTTALGAADQVGTFAPVSLSQQPTTASTSANLGGSREQQQAPAFVQATPALTATTTTATNTLAAAVVPPATGPTTQQGQAALIAGDISTQTLASPVAASHTAATTQQQTRRRQVEQSPTRSSSGRLARQRSSHQLQQEQQQRNGAELGLFDQIHSAFQSNRISSLGREARSQHDSAIVMRRQPAQATATSDLLGAQTAPKAKTGAPATVSLRTPQSAAATTTTTAASNQQRHHNNHAVAVEAAAASAFADEEPMSFWRRAFDVQLMAPKFESLLSKRRV